MEVRGVRWWWLDAGLAAALTALNLSVAFGFLGRIPSRAPIAVGLLLGLGGVLVMRRRWPWWGLLATFVVTAALVAAGFPSIVVTFAPLVMLYTVASQAGLPAAWWGLGASLAGVMVVETLAGWEQDPSTVSGNVVLLAAAWMLGIFTASRQHTIAELSARTAELEEARQELARKAVVEERLRIARELHDIVAHALGVVAVRSGVAAHVAAERPAEVVEALSAIQAASRTALDDMRRLLGVLRDEGSPDDPLAPMPGAADLQGLVDSIEDAGLPVELSLAGDVSGLDQGVGLTIYRLVQESLTNAVRHARATRASVAVRLLGDAVEVEVCDDGQGADAAIREGHGIRGMRERVAMYAGTIDVGRRPGGGFRVHAVLPTTAAGNASMAVTDAGR